jgi:hypothetical protein
LATGRPEALASKELFKMRRFILATLATASLCTSASAAGKPKTLEELFAPLSQGACVTIDAVRTVGMTTQLTPEQFQFVRAFWMAIPPTTPELPPGDKAFLAKDSNGVAVFGLFDDGGQVCAVFQATDWIERVVNQVGRGETGKLGQAM